MVLTFDKWWFLSHYTLDVWMQLSVGATILANLVAWAVWDQLDRTYFATSHQLFFIGCVHVAA